MRGPAGTRAFSTDRRERVVAACDADDATRERVAARFSISVAWIRKLIRQRRETGSIAPKPRGGGRAPALDHEAERRLREAVRPSPDATLAELERAAGVVCRPSAMYRALKRLGITCKKWRGGRPSRTGRG